MTRLVHRRHRSLAVLAALLAVAVVAVPAAAGVAVRRTWTAAIGTGGTSGSSRLVAFTDGTGTLVLDARRLAASRIYSVRIHSGTCSRLGRAYLTLPAIAGDATGAARAAYSMSGPRMNAVYSAYYARGAIAIRLVSGASVRCGTYTFPTATRVVISGIGVDMPVVLGPRGTLYCKVAMYLRQLSQPREPGVTYLYAHARRGMFLPLLTASWRNDGASLIGRTVRVYTSDSRYWTYRISRVRRHQTSIQSAFGIGARQLWLQTSEGPYASSLKLVVIALPTGGPYRASYAASHPTPHPYACPV